jgi:hypothetical protein
VRDTRSDIYVVATGYLISLLSASVGGPIVLGAALAVWGTKAFTAYTQYQRDNQVQELQDKTIEAQELSQQL